MASQPEQTPEIIKDTDREADLGDTIEFTPEEAQALKVYAGWVEHRNRAMEGDKIDS